MDTFAYNLKSHLPKRVKQMQGESQFISFVPKGIFYCFLFENIYLYNLKRCAIAALSGIFGNLVAKIIAIEESG